MLTSLCVLGFVLADLSLAQSSTVSTTATSTSRSSSSSSTDGLLFSFTNTGITVTDYTGATPSGSYVSYSAQRTLSSTQPRNATYTSNSLYIVGTNTLSNATTTSTASAPVNTQPCNGYVEFCNRKYSNITEVCAHNSAFSIANNIASNQQLPVIAQLNDGIRMIQGETRPANGTIYSCHSSCDLLNAGTLESQLTLVREWIEANPYNVVTILLVNSEYVPVQKYVDPIVNSGLERYAYRPPKTPMYRDDWPTLGQMILRGTRAVIFMDYEANQTAVPYILDEFSQMWETPFSPTDIAFPCTDERPPGLSTAQADERLYLANHNLNLPLNISGTTLLIPDTQKLEQVNAVSGKGSLGAMATECRKDWHRPPNFLLVDYYNIGNGSVFEVAAQMNGVKYSGKCCGLDTLLQSSATKPRIPLVLLLLMFVFL